MTNFQNYRTQDLNQKLQVGNYRPLDVMLAGSTGAGKSSTINALFGEKTAKVGHGVNPETMEVSSFMLNRYFRIWDTPGLGDGIAADASHSRKMTELLLRQYELDGCTYGLIDMVMVLIEGSERELGTTFRLLNHVILPCISPDRVIVMVNQADMGMKSFHWLRNECQPDEILRDFLNDKAYSIRNRIYEATGTLMDTPVCFSAEYGYNVRAVYDRIIEKIPDERRKI